MDLISTRHTIGRRALSLLLSFVMVSSMVLPAMGMTIAVVTTENKFTAGGLVSDDGLVTIAYGADAGIPEGATISVAEVTDSERYYAAAEGMLGDWKKAVYSRFFDIDIVSESGESVFLLAPVEVKINIADAPVEETTGVSVFHFADEAETIAEDGEIPLAAPEMSLKGLRSKNAVLTMGEGEVDEVLPSDEIIDPESVVDAANVEEVHVTENTGETVSFFANGFSVYGVIFTVDFTYEVGGKEFAYSITGGSGIGLSELLPLLGVVTDNPETEEDEVRDFVNDVDSVEFTDPSLVWVGKVEEECTVGQIKDENRLNCEYSAELTEEDITAMNEKTVNSGDWALISLTPFESEEGLSITMKNKEVLFITVTDAIMEAKSNADKGTPFMGRDTKTLDGITINLFDYGPDTLDSHANNMLNC